MCPNITELKKNWLEKSDLASGKLIIEIFGDAAMESWEGAEALIDAYLELEELTGEGPSMSYIGDILYFKIKGYWGEELSIDQLNKLDRFLSRCIK